MAMFAKNLRDRDDEQTTELLPAVIDEDGAQIVFPNGDDRAPTRDDLPYGYARGYLPAQNGGYLGQVLDPAQISRLMGPQPLPTPRPLVKVNHFFTHLHQARLLPGLGVLTLAGAAVWAHDEPYHPLVGGVIIACGALLIRSGVKAHRVHGEDADQVFTRGAAAAGVFAAFIGTGVTAGMSKWMALAVAVATAAGYIVDGAVRHFKLREQRHFAAGLVAAGNTGPQLPVAPPPSPWGGPVSDEEYRLRQAFTRLKAPEVILSPVRRVNDDAWSVYADVRDTGTTTAAVAKDADKLATWMGARRVEALPDPDRKSVVKLIVHFGDDPLGETVEGPGPQITSIMQPLPIGRFEDLTEIEYSLPWNHLLIAGATDNGKSGVMDALIVGTLACTDVVRIGIDCKAGAPSFGVYRPVMMHVAETPEDGMRVLAGLLAVYEYRGKLLGEKSVPSEENEEGIPVRKWRTEFGPFILAPIDELYELTGAIPGAAKAIQRLNALSRYVAIVKADATQNPSRNVFDKNTDARLNYQGRIGLRVAETNAINMIMGQGALGRNWRLDQLNGQGKLMIQSRVHDRPRVGRGYYYTDERIARFVAEYADLAQSVKLDEGSNAAFWEGYDSYGKDDEDESDGGGPRGGQRSEPQDAVPAGAVYTGGGTAMYLVPTYPGGEKIDTKHQALWQLLGEYGRNGASVRQLAARAEALGHKYASRPWVSARLEYWVEAGYADRVDGREAVYWRKDLRSEPVRDGASA